MGTMMIALILAVENPEIFKSQIIAHLIYCSTPPFLATTSDAMCQNPAAAPDMVAKFIDNRMYTAQTPGPLRTWHIRRVLEMDGIALAGCGQAIVDLFKNAAGRTSAAKVFMRKKAARRLVVTTDVLPAVAEWEAELGLGTLDEFHTLNEGTFSHFVDSERFNYKLRPG
jgi:hypothetical protein